MFENCEIGLQDKNLKERRGNCDYKREGNYNYQLVYKMKNLLLKIGGLDYVWRSN